MRAQFVPEWASPVSRVIRAAFLPQRVHPANPFSNPPLGTSSSADQAPKGTTRAAKILSTWSGRTAETIENLRGCLKTRFRVPPLGGANPEHMERQDGGDD